MTNKLAFPIAFLIVAMIGFWMVVAPKNNLRKDARVEKIEERNEPAQSWPDAPSDDPFFVYNNGSQTDFFHGDQFFGTQDKVGVNATVMNDYSNEIADFMFIGGRKADREQLLTGLGIPLNPDRKWMVKISKAGIVNGDVRVRVIAHIGADDLNGGVMMKVQKTVDEVWKLDLVGATPTLLDRGVEFHKGLSTYAESPPQIYPEGALEQALSQMDANNTNEIPE